MSTRPFSFIVHRKSNPSQPIASDREEMTDDQIATFQTDICENIGRLNYLTFKDREKVQTYVRGDDISMVQLVY